MVISLFRVELSLPRWDGRWAHQFPLPDSFIKPKYKRCLRHQDLLVSCRHTEIDWTILLSMHMDAAIKNLQNSIMNVSLEKYRAEFLIPALPWWVPSPGESTKGKVSSTFSAKPCHRLQFTSLPSFFTWIVEDVSKIGSLGVILGVEPEVSHFKWQRDREPDKLETQRHATFMHCLLHCDSANFQLGSGLLSSIVDPSQYLDRQTEAWFLGCPNHKSFQAVRVQVFASSLDGRLRLSEFSVTCNWKW